MPQTKYTRQQNNWRRQNIRLDKIICVNKILASTKLLVSTKYWRRQNTGADKMWAPTKSWHRQLPCFYGRTLSSTVPACCTCLTAPAGYPPPAPGRPKCCEETLLARSSHWSRLPRLAAYSSILWPHHRCSAQTRTGIGLPGKPPAEKQFPTVESHLGKHASYATQRNCRYEANKCG